MRVLLLLLALLPPLATAQIYRWTDAEGRVHFGQRPAAGAEQVEVRPQIIERDEATRQREERSEKFFDARRQEQQADAAQVGKQRAQREKECRGLREELAVLQRGGRYFRTDAAGERVYYSESEIEKARQQLASRIRQRCD
ncbi:DUF4124 domain-containing protein [Stutzerimonas stutzeri]|uniref:DUF4124 domain-containing protein n=1 Tax=Stutzerimonas sp. S1 TaxID=3030652 RepID=UPI0022249F04|nr:DUF4124 domain-containing protein [Stutzerimonas sp. S1]MCW3149940.1 DUF4124 domain-containing protein [Stutzerimonas sp. S1]